MLSAGEQSDRTILGAFHRCSEDWRLGGLASSATPRLQSRGSRSSLNSEAGVIARDSACIIRRESKKTKRK